MIVAGLSVIVGFAWARWAGPVTTPLSSLLAPSSDRLFVTEESTQGAASPELKSFWPETQAQINRAPSSYHLSKINDALLDVRPEDAPFLLQNLPANLSKEDRAAWISGLIGLWAENDPEAAVKAAETYPELSGPSRSHQAYSEWGKKDAAAALAYARQMPAGTKRSSVLQEILSGLAQQDIQKALTLAEGPLASELESWALGTLYSRLARQNPQAALQRALQRKNISPYDDQVLRSVMQTWASRDLNGARAAVTSVTNERSRQEMLLAVTTAGLTTDPEAAAAFLAPFLPKEMDWENPLLRNSHQIINIAMGDEDKVKRFLAKLPPGPITQQLQQAMWQQRTQYDPNGVWSEITRLPPGPERNKALQLTLSNWGYQNPTEALQRAQSLTGDERVQALSSVLSTWGSSDPAAVLDYVSQPGREALQKSAFQNMGWGFQQFSPEAAEAMLSRIPPTYRKAPLTAYLSSLALTDPDRAFSLLQKNIPETEQKKVVQEISGRFAYQSPARAAEWLEILPEGPERTESLKNLAATWSDVDSAGVTAWLNKLPASPSRDGAIEQFVNKAQVYDPESATLWAASISDEKKQQAIVVSSWKEWNRRNPSAAQVWKANSSLPATVKQELKP
jgi:hypothetical protein